GDGGREPVALADDPVGHVAAVGPSAHAHAGGVDVAGAFDQLIDRAHQVQVVLPAPVTHDLAPEPLPVPVGPARVHIEDDVAHAGEDLELVEEAPAVLGARAAVDLHDQRVEPARVVLGRLEDPALEAPPVGRDEVFLLRLRGVAGAAARGGGGGHVLGGGGR